MGFIDILTPADPLGSDLLPATWPLWQDFFYQLLVGTNVVPASGGPPAMFYVFVGILVTFLVTRGITRFIRHRSASSDGAPSQGPIRDIVIGGVHVHHQVFGIVLMTLSGLLLIAIVPDGPALAVLAVAFGAGIGLAFDEFALWLHVDDVYWSREGRKSVDAVAIVLVVTGVITVAVGVVRDSADIGDVADLIGPVILHLAVAAIVSTFVPAVLCLLKGKPITAGAGVVYVPLGIIGAVRLAKPQSWWARHLYPSQSRRRRRSDERFGDRYEARWDRIRDLIGGGIS